MDAVGVRELKANLSRYLKQVQRGTTVVVTDRGRTIATIQPVARNARAAWAHAAVAAGGAAWNGGKPTGAPVPIRLKRGRKTAARMLLDDRR